MTIYTYCLAKTGIGTSLSALYDPPTKAQVPGLIQAECMAKMKLGAPVFSPARMQLHHLAMFAVWESEDSINNFMLNTRLGQQLSAGWHVRMTLLRRWGSVKEFDGLPESTGETHPAATVVAVTLARMRLTQIPRFIRWGKPVEELVRDHPGSHSNQPPCGCLELFPPFPFGPLRKEMTEMVHGHGKVEPPERHASAMKERDRKDFHFEFTTLRFKPISEHGTWEGRRAAKVYKLIALSSNLHVVSP